jgi:hypothetical protein
MGQAVLRSFAGRRPTESLRPLCGERYDLRRIALCPDDPKPTWSSPHVGDSDASPTTNLNRANIWPT